MRLLRYLTVLIRISHILIGLDFIEVEVEVVVKTEKFPQQKSTVQQNENEVIVDFSLQFKIVFECLRTVVVVETEFGVRVSVFEFSSLLREEDDSSQLRTWTIAVGTPFDVLVRVARLLDLRAQKSIQTVCCSQNR